MVDRGPSSTHKTQRLPLGGLKFSTGVSQIR
jgi:hypothetical protein